MFSIFNLTKSQKLGISICASWAWGTSLIIGMEIAQQKGLYAWCIWAVANVLTLSFFGELTRRGILGRRIFDIKAIKILAIFIQIFCLIIQMNIINKVIIQMGGNQWLAYGVASLTGIIFILLMYKRGLVMSVLTDRWEWALVMIAIPLILIIGLISGVEKTIYPMSSSSDII